MEEFINQQTNFVIDFSKWIGPIAIDIAIVGAGPRGLSVLERIIAFARAKQFSPDVNLNINIFDPNPLGAGCHYIDQAEHLLVNTIASQITIFSDHTVQGSGFILDGPSFYEWLCDYTSSSQDPNAYYPRKLLCEYLQWGFRYLCELAPEIVNIKPVAQRVVSASCSLTTWYIQTENGDKYHQDYVFLTTGHEQEILQENEANRRLFSAYPLHISTSGIQSHETIALEGLGLSTCDVLSMLTIGRGGKFFRNQEQVLCYQASQKEPKIIAFSRSGLPLSARAKNEKEAREQYKANFLTRKAISDLKEKYQKINFAVNLLPLLLNDMEFVYSKTYIKKHHGHIAANIFANAYLTVKDNERKSLVVDYIPLQHHFNWENLVNPIPPHALESQNKFNAWLDDYLVADVRNANEGNVSNPLKAACDVLRDVRDNIRYAIDFAGLTESSHRWLFYSFIPVMNRLAVGPPKIRIEEILALKKAGILKIDLGINPEWKFDETSNLFVINGQFETIKSDVLIRSRIAMPSPQQSSNLLLRQLINDGFARPFFNKKFHPNGLDISSDFNLISRDNNVYQNFWVLGTPTEGAKFYTFILPRPFVNSTALLDADRIVQSLVNQINAKSAPSEHQRMEKVYEGK
ncbi:FAD/NAD(P)-binding protein [Fortiea contorta]|uniref:FAD/NAD(P)-binding protein n=1 Tax=Fortiea contorta TaxID=1892405 RepID=UPI00034B8CED|nr:FAD/NAD(P)-binding protein [Fortiea contorta]